MRVCLPFRDTFGIILGTALLSIFASKQTSLAFSPRECQRSAQNLISKLLNGVQRTKHRTRGSLFRRDIAEFCEIVNFVKKHCKLAKYRSVFGCKLNYLRLFYTSIFKIAIVNYY